MADEFVVATEKYGSGSRERKYRFSTESGNIERIGRKRDSAATSVQQFFKVCQLCCRDSNPPDLIGSLPI